MVYLWRVHGERGDWRFTGLGVALLYLLCLPLTSTHIYNSAKNWPARVSTLAGHSSCSSRVL